MGYGFSTKCFHLPFITPNADLEAYAFLQRAEAPADKKGVEAGKHCTVDYPNAKHYRTADDFFADSEIERSCRRITRFISSSAARSTCCGASTRRVSIRVSSATSANTCAAKQLKVRSNSTVPTQRCVVLFVGLP